MISDEQIRKGLRNPRDIPPFIFRSVINIIKKINYGGTRIIRQIPRQRALIHDLIEKDSFALIVLDACRYDVFAEEIDNYLAGDLRLTWGSGRWTGEYTIQTWTDYYDLLYISSIPVVSDMHFKNLSVDYRPSEHFDGLLPLWDSGWDPERGTVPAHQVTDSALKYVTQTENPRFVAHYAQPHVPYIGDEEILPWEGVSERGIQERLTDDDQPTKKFYSMIRNGEISDERLQTAYRDNLRYVLSDVIRLVRRLDCPIVITSDHGEHLGENNKYLHKIDSKKLREVPWFVVDEAETSQKEIEDEYQVGFEVEKSTSTDADIKDRLAHLGYY